MRTAEENSGAGTRSGAFFVRVLLAISAVAWLLRLLAAWEMSRAGGGINNMFTPPPTSDLATYMTLGRECAAGNFPAGFYYQPYYYAVFLAAIYRTFGQYAIYAVIGIQSALSAATVFLTGWCGRRIFGPRAGLVAAGITAISASLILYVPFHQNETVQTFHLTLLFFLTLRAVERPTWSRWLPAGAVAGVAILTRGNIWLLTPVIAGFLLGYGPPKRKWAYLAGTVAVMLAVQLPFILRNSLSGGTLRGASTAADAVLALGNGPDAPAGGRSPGERAGAMYYSESYRRMMANTAGEFPRSVPAQMWDFMLDDPLGFWELQFRKALLFWDGREIPNNVSLEYDGIAESRVLRWLIPGRNPVMLTLGLAGLLWYLPALRRDRRGGLRLLYGFTLTFYLAVTAFYILSRFKAPLLPLLAVFGGGFLCACNRVWRRRRRNHLAVAVAALTVLFACWVTTRSCDFYRGCEAAVQRFIHPDGLRLDMRGGSIMLLDHGPRPFGGWLELPLTPGMSIDKDFAETRTLPADLQIMMSNVAPARVALRLNGQRREFDLPPAGPGRSEHKFVTLPGSLIGGRLHVEVLRAEGGPVTVTLDSQRDYGRSRLDGRVVAGEWVIRAGIPRGF